MVGPWGLGPFRRALSILTIACLMTTMLVAGVPARAQVPGEEPPPTDAILDPGEVLRAISFRTVAAWTGAYDAPRAGRYVAVGNGMKMYRGVDGALKPRDAVSPLNVQFGVFLAGGGRVKLLGPNGLWVTLTSSDGQRVAVARAASWRRAVPLKVVDVPYAELDPTVIEALTTGPDPSPTDGLVCLEAFDQAGGSIGHLAVTKTDVRLSAAGSCGASLRLLYNTDLPPGTAATTQVAHRFQDPLLQVRFVPPDRPNLTMGPSRIADTVSDVKNYFQDLKLDLQQFDSDTGKRIEWVRTRLEKESITIPNPPKTDVTMQIIGGVIGLGSAIPVIGGAFGAASSLVSLVQAGMTLADQANSGEPRVLDSVANNQLDAVGDVLDRMLTHFDQLYTRAGVLRNRILVGCTINGSGCASDRALRVWWNDPPPYPRPAAATRAIQANASQLERGAWITMLPARGVVYADQRVWLGNWETRVCEAYAEAQREPINIIAYANSKELLPGGAATSPYLYAAIGCRQLLDIMLVNEYLEYHALFRVGLINNVDLSAPDVPTPLDDAAVSRLFEPFDVQHPYDGGLGFGRREIACLLTRSWPVATISDFKGVPIDPKTSFVGCDFDHTTATGARWKSPNYGEPENLQGNWGGETSATLLRYKPGSFAVWIPDEAQLDAGRDIRDYDVIPAQEPRATWSSCAVAGDVRSTSGGTPTTLYFLNVTGDIGTDPGVDVTVTMIGPDGSEGPSAVIPAGRPLKTRFDTYAPVQWGTTVGTVFVARAGGQCLGVWTAPAGSYSVAEIHRVG